MKRMLISAVVIVAIAASGASALASGPQTAERAALLVRVNVTASDTNCVDASMTVKSEVRGCLGWFRGCGRGGGRGGV